MNTINATSDPVAMEEQINALLPQTQCQKCGHPGCRPYARGILQGEAINKCPPGGSATIANLATLLSVPALPLDTSRGETLPRLRAFIREAECIGCTKCIQVCPTDAILGAAKLMHTVLETECTGCDLCLAPCPVDCIDLLPVSSAETPAVAVQARYWQDRFEYRQARLQREANERSSKRSARQLANSAQTDEAVSLTAPAAERKSTAQLQLEIAAAVARAQARKAARQS